jgi:DNA adenine methylase
MDNLIVPPFNYAGCKLELLPQLKEYFPKNIHTFVDAFAGSGAVFINTEAERYIVNDAIKPLIYFMELLYKNANEKTTDVIDRIELLKLTTHLTKDNPSFKEAYYEFRNAANEIMQRDEAESVKGLVFYLLLCCCHNNLIRFNKNMIFNQTFGNRTFNTSMKNKLITFREHLKNKNIIFLSCGFEDLFLWDLYPRDFIYLDPPYLISEAGYNTLWSIDKEVSLYRKLDTLTEKGIRWGLSNILTHKGETNIILASWMSKYNSVTLEKDYLKVAKKKQNDTVEVYVYNYEKE